MNVQRYRIGGETVFVFQPSAGSPHVYRPVGQTDVPRAICTHDGPALVDGQIVYVEYDGGLFEAYGHSLPRMSMPTWTPRDKLGQPAVLLERVHAEQGGGWR